MVLTPKQMYERERYLKRKATEEAERQRKNYFIEALRTSKQSLARLAIATSSTTPDSLKDE